MRPGIFVELGAHNGFSYLAFCQAVQRLGATTKCYAVDTWRGDEHAGFYGEEVFAKLNELHERRYSGFSRLIRSTFDEALPHFSDGTVDLLHIDGRHRYQDVAHDFESWLPKLSDRAVVLLHDINVRERGFGVWQFWADLQARYRCFEFAHGYGLGVVQVGRLVAAPLRPLFDSIALRVMFTIVALFIAVTALFLSVLTAKLWRDSHATTFARIQASLVSIAALALAFPVSP